MNIEPKTVTLLFAIFLSLKTFIENLLERRNLHHILAHRDEVPERFQDQISLEEHQKAADYSVTKIRAGKVFGFFNLLILLGWTVLGGLNFLQTQIAPLELGPIKEGLLFISLFGVISTILSLPQSLYSTFVIEEKFGFNKVTPVLFVKDMIKGLVLGAVIVLPLIAALLWVMIELGQSWWLYGWALFTSFQFLILWGYPRFIAPLFNKFSEMEEGEHKEKVLALLNRTGFTSNGLFVMDASIRSSHGNAYFTGFGKNKRIVFFDTLLKTLEPGEVEAVLAHELGHFKKKHIIKQLTRSVVMSLGAFYLLGQLMNWQPFFAGHGVETMELHLALILFMLVSGNYVFWLTPLTSAISRKYEFEADDFAARHAEAKNLISALVKLYKDNASTLTPDPTYSAYYHSHPPALTRVDHLEKLAH